MSLLVCTQLFAKPDVIIRDGFENQNMSPCFRVFEDHTKTLEAQAILDNNLLKKFNQNSRSKLNFGYTSNPQWAYTVLFNNESKQRNLIFELSNPHLDRLHVFIVKDKTIVDSYSYSQGDRAHSTTPEHRYILIPIEIASKEKVSILISAFNNGDSISLPCQLWDTETFITKDSRRSIYIGIAFGIIFLIIIINIYLVVISKQKSSINYLLFVVPTFLALLNYEGVTSLLPPGFGWFSSDQALLLFSLIGTIYFLCFFETLNAHDKRLARRYWFIFGLKVASGAIAATSFFTYPYFLFAVFGTSIIIPVTYISVIIISIQGMKDKKSFNWLILSSIAIPSIGLGVYLLRDFGLMGSNLPSSHSLLFAFFGQVLLFFILTLDLFRRNQIKTANNLARNSELMERQKLDLQIALSNLEKLSLIAQETENCIVIFNNKGDVTWINDSFKRIYNKTLNELENKNTNFSQIYSKRNKGYFEKCIALKKSIKFEAQQLTSRHEIRWSQITLTPSLGTENEVFEVIAIEADITEIKQMQIMLHKAKEKAEEGSKLKTAFLSNMSHELRTPLNGIIGFSDLILDKYELDPKLHKFIGLIKENGHHLLGIICDLLDVSRIEAGAISISNNSFESINLLDELYKHAESAIGREKQEITIYKEYEASSKNIYSDRTKIKQILINFINNALKFTHEGYIKIGFKSYTDSFVFYVEDTGIGIGEEEAKVIFKRFRQSDDSATREYGGVGVGLTISAGLAKLLNAKINFKSQKGKGSTFYIEIPNQNTIKTNKEANISTESNLSLLENAKILTVFDSENDFNLVEAVLKEYKALCFFAKNADDAIFRLQKGMTPDIVIADIVPQDNNSLTFISHIKHIRPQASLIGVAMVSSEQDIKTAIEAGCNAVIGKPPEPTQLISTVTGLLKNKEGKTRNSAKT